MANNIERCPGCKVAYSEHWQCAVCHHFGHDNAKARYDQSICRDCDRALAQRGARYCRDCDAVLPRANFYASGGRLCRTCTYKRTIRDAETRVRRREALRAYRQANRDRLLEKYREYRQSHPDRVKAARDRAYAKYGAKARARMKAKRASAAFRASENERRRAYLAINAERLNQRRRERKAARLIAILKEARP
jgi:hypothetical protein